MTPSSASHPRTCNGGQNVGAQAHSTPTHGGSSNEEQKHASTDEHLLLCSGGLFLFLSEFGLENSLFVITHTVAIAHISAITRTITIAHSFATIGSVVSILGPSVGGFSYGRLGPTFPALAPSLIGCALAGMGVAAALAWLPETKPRPPPSASLPTAPLLPDSGASAQGFSGRASRRRAVPGPHEDLRGRR